MKSQCLSKGIVPTYFNNLLPTLQTNTGGFGSDFILKRNHETILKTIYQTNDC